jgi:hypothetical protein
MFCSYDVMFMSCECEQTEISDKRRAEIAQAESKAWIDSEVKRLQTLASSLEEQKERLKTEMEVRWHSVRRIS